MTSRTQFYLQNSCLVALLALTATAAGAQIQAPKKASFVLSADHTAYEAGGPAKVAALVTIEPGWHVNSHKPTFEYLIPTILDLELPEGWAQETVQYPPAEMQSFSFANQPLAVYDGDVVILANLSVPAKAAQGTYPVRASLRFQACNDSQCLPPVTADAEIQLTVGPGGKPQNPDLFQKSAAVATPPVPGGEEIAPAAPAAEPAAERAEAEDEEAGAAAPVKGGKGPGGGLAGILLLAVLGGLILNAMPCVLPVLSLKIFGLVRSAGHGRSEVARGALATSAGILSSFLVLALAAVAARSAGSAVGWGVQFQRPGFVAFLAVVVVLFCLNLWGLFEIPLPQRLARLGGSGPREGAAGHFVSGLFATLMATPCSAPFLGTAISFALAQSAPVVLAVFAALGLGMALPYLLIAVAPGIARLFPRPGAWMETVRGVMGFLLAASAVWLFYVLSSQVAPEQLAAIQLGLLGIALFTWIGHRIARSRAFRSMAAVGVLAAIAVTLFTAAGSPGRATSAPQVAGRTGGGHIEWVEFDRSQAESMAAGGQLVFVDVTADWCFTCKVNERLILDTPEVAGAFEEHGVVPMKADWTNRNDTIAKFLAEHGRYGIPFYLLYRPGQEPHVFGELPSKDGLVQVVREAASGRPIAQR
jgi:suppressor for copper-sensitivity B